MFHAFALVVLGLSVASFGQRIEWNRGAEEASLKAVQVPARSGLNSIELNLSIPFIDVEKEDSGFDRVSAPGLSPLATVGNPELFGTGRLVAVPPGHGVAVEVVQEDKRTVEGIVVRPFEDKSRCGGGPRPFMFNQALYGSRSVFPSEPVRLESVGKLQDLEIVRVGLNPIRMNFGQKSLEVSTHLNVRIHFVELERKSIQLPKSLFEFARTITVNGQGLGDTVRVAPAAESMVIITADAHTGALQPLVKWKQQKGYQVLVVPASTAGATADAVKVYLQNLYDTAAVKPSYFLFVGNKTTLPAFFESTSAGKAISDMKYALLSGADNVPDVLYGRLAADNDAEVKTQIDRWIAYEKSPDRGSWYPQGTTIASNEGSNPSDKDYAVKIQEALKAHTYTHMDSFFQGEQTATAKNITEGLNAGRTWLAYFGHGSGTSWGSTNDAFSNATVKTLQNAEKLPILIDVACLNGNWGSASPSFGKTWVTHEVNGKPAGAVGFYGGSVSISWHPPAVMSVGIAKYHFEKPVHSLGGSVLAGQMYLVEQMGANASTLDNLKWYNLLSDPSLVVRTNTPQAYEVVHHLKRMGRDVTMEVKVTSLEGHAVESLNAVISANGGAPLAVGKTDANGVVSLTVEGVGSLGPHAVLTTTGYNMETQEIQISE